MFRKVKLKHQIVHLKKDSVDENAFLAADSVGNTTIINQRGEIIREFSFQNEVNSIDFSYPMARIFIANKEGLTIINFKYEVLRFFESEYLSVIVIKNHFWAVKYIDEESCQLELYEIKSSKLISSKLIKDLNYNSSFILFPGFNEHSVVLWLAAGQNGTTSYIINFIEGQISINEFPDYDSWPITFLESGSLFSITKPNRFYKIYHYPSMIEKLSIDLLENDNLYEEIINLNSHQLLFHSYDKLEIYNIENNTISEVNLFEYNKDPIIEANSVLDIRLISFIQKLNDLFIISCENSELILTNLSSFEYRKKGQLKLQWENSN
ncbi:MAG: hypothetical protein CMO01_04270 [Thalassobius sp.]|nr:hypothetical protein [Thalassovita sp.]